ncbi:tetratricopeptide repeat protein [Stenotrophomonas sp. UBA7606]|uniref:tetratricopeptide repeat protein n=1 Tax=Stenotrophomonas sp. UBA7606 TaxID=1947559 RepID=UPI0025FFE8A8|nr:tetratricopeptide repeat protein [Stenotrophomonas sp. UBA7606]
MSPIILLSLLLQIACCVHVVRTGRPLYWIFIILVFSYLAVLIYFIAEVLPGLRNNPAARRGLRQVRDQIDPQRRKREADQRLRVSDTVDNRRHLGDEHLARGEYAEAAAQFESAMRGIHREDPELMLGLAKAQYGLGQAAKAKQTLDALIAANPSFRSHEGHLLYARTVEDSGDIDAALHEYDALVGGYPGEEARLRYALLLKRKGRDGDAVVQLRNILDRAETSPRYYQQAQRAWIDAARKELRLLEPAG